jgi:hypothetical protein
MNPIDQKNLKNAAIVIAGLGLLYFLFGKKTDNSGSTQDPTGNGGYVPVPTVFNAKNTATALYEAMKDSGTEEEAILEILKYVNQSQFAQVVTAFGSLNYNELLGNQLSTNPFTPLPKVNLKGWLKEELSAKDYAILRAKYPYYL